MPIAKNNTEPYFLDLHFRAFLDRGRAQVEEASVEEGRRSAGKGIAWTEDEHRFVVPASCPVSFPFR